MTVQFVVPDSNVGAHGAVTELDVTHAALEAVDVVEKTQTLDYHSGASTCDQPGLMSGRRSIKGHGSVIWCDKGVNPPGKEMSW